jgi:hypothetical protein
MLPLRTLYDEKLTSWLNKSTLECSDEIAY